MRKKCSARSHDGGRNVGCAGSEAVRIPLRDCNVCRILVPRSLDPDEMAISTMLCRRADTIHH